jgi:hypothetical protein
MTKEEEEIPETCILKKVVLWHLRPRGWSYLLNCTGRWQLLNVSQNEVCYYKLGRTRGKPTVKQKGKWLNHVYNSRC